MKPIRSFVKRNSFAVFVALAFLFSMYPFAGHWFTGADGVKEAWLRAGLWCLLALGLLIATGLKLARAPQVQAQATLVGQPLAAK